LLELSVTGKSCKELGDIEFHFVKELEQVAFSFRRA